MRFVLCVFIALICSVIPASAQDDYYKIGPLKCPPVTIAQPGKIYMISTEKGRQTLQEIYSHLGLEPKLASAPRRTLDSRQTGQPICIPKPWRPRTINPSVATAVISSEPSGRCPSFLSRPRRTRPLPPSLLPAKYFLRAHRTTAGLPSPGPLRSPASRLARSRWPTWRSSRTPSPRKRSGERTARFHVQFIEPPTSHEVAWKMHKVLSELKPFYEKLYGYGDNFKLPRTLTFVFAETGVANCWYEPSKHRVVMTYDMMNFFYKERREAWSNGR